MGLFTVIRKGLTGGYKAVKKADEKAKKIFPEVAGAGVATIAAGKTLEKSLEDKTSGYPGYQPMKLKKSKKSKP